jgi:hypothetical protein
MPRKCCKHYSESERLITMWSMTQSNDKPDANESAAIANRPFAVALVSAYLFMVGVWLLVTRQIRVPELRKVLLSRIRPRFKGELTAANMRKDDGAGFVVDVPAYLLSDKEAASALVLLENGKTLGPAHSMHDDIRRLGKGRFCHWGSEIYFSASDNSDPRTNGCKYTVIEIQ